MKKTILEISRFLIVGVVSFIIDLGLLVVFQEFVFKAVKNGVLFSTALSFSISLIVHYFLAVFWVFRNHKVVSSVEHAVASSLFIATNVVGLGINELVMWVGVSILSYHYIFIKLVSTAVVMFWNYACQKLVIFTKDSANDK